MTDETMHYNGVAALGNVMAFLGLVRQVENRPPGLPGMATFYGPSGFGKSTAGAYVANVADAHLVQVKSTWRAKKLVCAIATELGLKPAKTISDIVDQVSEALARSGRTLILDEADVLCRADLIEIVRDIYESSMCAVVLIGEENLPQTLRQWERVHGRMMGWVAAEPGTLDDLRQLAAIYCPDVAIAPALEAAIMRASGTSIRRICVNLAAVREQAAVKHLATVDVGDVRPASFATGEAPAPRRFA